MKHIFVILLSLTLVVLPTFAQEANLREDCVTEFSPDVDYFPEKIDLQDAQNLSVDYHNHYKVVTVTDAFDSAEPFTYVLVQCGTPAPSTGDFPDDTQFIDVPTGNIIAMSTTQLPSLVQLDLLDNLVGLDSLANVNTPEVQALIESGELIEVGADATVNVEAVLNAEPDIVMTFAYNPDTSAHPILIDADIFTAINASWREATPLGRAEWIKYMALFYNAEATAEIIYDEMATAYHQARDLASSIPEDDRPFVLWNRFSAYTEAWTIPGTETYAGALIQDAGGLIAPVDAVSADNVPLSFELIYDGAYDADVWVTNAFGVTTLDELLANDSRYADFLAVRSGNVWNNTRDLNENGGNNYFELGVSNPHLILQDLIAIFHPELLPDHEFSFYLPLEPEENADD